VHAVGAPLPGLELNLHQIDSPQLDVAEKFPSSCGLWWVLLLSLAAGMGHADPQPTPAMMAPVRTLAAFMSTLPPGEHRPVFARKGLCIVENFAPFLFCGRDAALAWERGFRAHAADEGLSELSAQFADAHDFNMSGNRCYFSLPTTWTGLTHGRRFEEHGAWAFVIEQHGAAWRILGYGYGVTAYTEAAQ
jgi:hypothetical protein